MSSRGREFRPRNLTTVSTRVGGTGTRARSSAMPPIVPSTQSGIGRAPMPTGSSAPRTSAPGTSVPSAYARAPLTTTTTRTRNEPTATSSTTSSNNTNHPYSANSPSRTHISERSTYSLTSQAERSASAHNTEMRNMNAQLNRLTRDLNTKIKRYKNETAESDLLLKRAQRLNERLDMLKYKLRLSFQMSGESAPDTLQITLRQMAAVDPDGAPPEYVCPITQCLMVDPVATCDGQVYDRCAIVEWFANFSGGRKPTSPLTNLPLDNLELHAQLELGAKIQQFLKEQTGAVSKHQQDKVLGTEEPNLRHLPSEFRNDGLGLTTPPLIPADDDDDEDADVEDAQATAGGGATGTPPPQPPQAKASAPRGPIWGSSVVPASETDSRILNLLRVDDSLPVPTVNNPHSRDAHVPTGSKAPVSIRGTGLGEQRRSVPQSNVRTEARLASAIQEATNPSRNMNTRSSALYSIPGRTGASSGATGQSSQIRTSAVRMNRPGTGRRGNSGARPTVTIDDNSTEAPLRVEIAPPLQGVANRVRAGGPAASRSTGSNNLNSRQRR